MTSEGSVSPLLRVAIWQVKTRQEVRGVDADFSLCRDREAHPSVHGWGVHGNCKTRHLP